MDYKPWEVQEDLWKEKCSWGNNQDKDFLVYHLSERTGKSISETLFDLEMAEQSGMLRTNEDSTVEIL
jgi:hypothetical protein